MKKFNRNYTCTLEIGTRTLAGDMTPQETVNISYPTTMVFEISRAMFSANNEGIFKFYNLSKDVQAKIWVDINQKFKYVKVTVNAGYGNTMPRIFTGLATQCFSYREGGSTDFITEIHADATLFLYQYGFSNMTLSKGTEFKNMIKAMVDDIPDLSIGWTTDKIEALKKDTLFCGPVMENLSREYSKYQIFIDNGKMHVLAEDDVIPGDIYVLTSESGLLGTPHRGSETVELDMIFEPGLIVGQAVDVLSDSLEWLNNTYKIIGLSHRGIISPTVSGKLTTHVILSLGNFNQLGNEIEPTISLQGWIKPVNTVITGRYGETRTDHTHKGIDYGCPMNTPVKAAYDGTVIIRDIVSGYGNAIYIYHGKINGNSVISRYGHLNTFNVAKNQKVSRGDIIAYSGNSGISTGPHLHFEIRENGNAVNPAKYIGN